MPEYPYDPNHIPHVDHARQTEPRIVTPHEAQRLLASINRDLRGATLDEIALVHTVATEPDRTRAAVVKALNHARTLVWDESGELAEYVHVIENGADW